MRIELFFKTAAELTAVASFHKEVLPWAQAFNLPNKVRFQLVDVLSYSISIFLSYSISIWLTSFYLNPLCILYSCLLLLSSILYPLSSILYPLSSILYPLSSILYPPLKVRNDNLFEVSALLRQSLPSAHICTHYSTKNNKSKRAHDTVESLRAFLRQAPEHGINEVLVVR
jgi:hypothetical protein